MVNTQEALTNWLLNLNSSEGFSSYFEVLTSAADGIMLI